MFCTCRRAFSGWIFVSAVIHSAVFMLFFISTHLWFLIRLSLLWTRSLSSSYLTCASAQNLSCHLLRRWTDFRHTMCLEIEDVLEPFINKVSFVRDNLVADRLAPVNDTRSERPEHGAVA